MSIVYVITSILIIVGWMLIQKSEKKLNVLSWIIISLVLLLAYNVGISYILNLFNIKINLINLSVINICVFIIELIYILKDKKIQKYEIKLNDIVYYILISAICLVIVNIQYGSEMNLKYQTTDSAIHYELAINFKENSKLIRDNSETYVSMPAAYVNSGIMMKIFNYDRLHSYKVFVLYDICIFILTAISMYVIMRELNHNNKKFLDFIAFLFAILYAIGYPLMSMLFGFSYLTIVLPIINLIIYFFEIYDKKIIDEKYWLGIILILNLFVFFAYYLFVPFVYISEFVYVIINEHTNTKKWITKNLLIKFIVIFLIPILISLQYFNFIKQITNGGKDIASAVSMDGYTYINKYSDFILLIPLAMVSIFFEIKNIKFSTYIFIATIAYIILFYIAKKFEIVTIYYIMKNYFVLWGIVHIMTYIMIIHLYDVQKYICIVGIIIYVLLLVNFSGLKVIYYSNYCLVEETRKDAIPTFTSSQLGFLNDVKDKINENTELVGNVRQQIWSSILVNYRTGAEERKIAEKIVKTDDSNYQYLIILKQNQENTDELIENKNIIYETEQGYVIQNY